MPTNKKPPLVFAPVTTDRLTKIFEVECGRHRLGQVRFCSPWRRYCFFPNNHTIYDATPAWKRLPTF